MKGKEPALVVEHPMSPPVAGDSFDGPGTISKELIQVASVGDDSPSMAQAA
ncbi:MAG: hypothetical protein QOJ93_1816 [Actinomycetota bacterium]|jgi:hypothetical protein|nr:hypothetical protein [Actinomycetota bacterium]